MLRLRKFLVTYSPRHAEFPKVGLEDCADTYGEKRLPLMFNAVQRSAVGA